MQYCEKRFQQNRVLTFYRIHRLYTTLEPSQIPNIEAMTMWSSSPTRHAMSGCFPQQFWEEKTYNVQMSGGSVTSQHSWLSCDHTFKSAANIGLFRAADGEWIQQYSGLFCVLNSNGEVLTWKLTRTLDLTALKTCSKDCKVQERLLLSFTSITVAHGEKKNCKIYLVQNCFVRCFSCHSAHY